MPCAHRLLRPTARAISQRVVFAAAGRQDWETAFKQKGMEGIVIMVPQGSTEKQVFAFPPKDLGDSFQAIFVGANPDDTTRGLLANSHERALRAADNMVEKV